MNSNSDHHQPGQPATELIFVYGTLRRGGSNHHRMAGGRFVSAASVRGTLYKVDWYPGLVLNPAAGKVIGELYQVPVDHIPALDQYEGPEYRRTQHPVEKAGGETAAAWIWEWGQPTDSLTAIPHGDWLHS